MGAMAAEGGIDPGAPGAGTIEGRTFAAPPSTNDAMVATRFVSSSSSLWDTGRRSSRAASRVAVPSWSAAASTFMRNTCADA